MSDIILGQTTESGKPVSLDIQRVLEGRLLLQANSGGGKSYAVRKICEVTHGHVQHIIIDPEGEFQTLREKYDYILVGKDGDIPINIRSAELLAERLLELGVSAIIDIYELKHNERKRFVKLFFDALVNARKELWHPCLVVLDEAHVFAPESSHGQAESLDAVKDMATRGRKRGFALVVATQRLSKLSKDVVAELNTKLIGRSSLDVDMKRASFELGFTYKEDIYSLRKLKKGEFYAFGSALTETVTKIKIGLCETTHPKAGEIYKKGLQIAPRDKIRQMLTKLADLPKEADEELKTKEDLKRKVLELKKEIANMKRSQSMKEKTVIPDKFQLQKAEQKGFKTAELQYMKQVKSLENKLSKFQQTLNQIQKVSTSALSLKMPKIEPVELPKEEIKPTVKPQVQPMVKPPKVDGDGLDKAHAKILTAIVQRPDHIATRSQVALVSGYSPKSGHFKNCLGKLRGSGLIEYDGQNLVATNEGIEQIGSDYDPLPMDSQSIQQFWLSKVSTAESKLLQVICEAFPNPISREELAMRVEYSNSSGHFKNMLGHLRSIGLIDYPNSQEVIATKELFPEMIQ